MRVRFSTDSAEDYRKFLKVKSLPSYRIRGRVADVPDEYARLLNDAAQPQPDLPYVPSEGLFDYQRDIAALAIRKRKFAVFAACGLGKGLPPEAPVLTPTGWTPIGLLQPGDTVIGADGKACSVTGVFPRGVQPLFRVTFSDGVSVVCDGDHLWNVRNPNDVARGNPWMTVETKVLASSQLKYGKTGQSRTWKIPSVSPVEFPEARLPIAPYVLGVLLGDGTLKQGVVNWSKPDVEVAEKVAASLSESVYVKHNPVEGRCDKWSILKKSGRSNPVSDELQELWLNGLKAHGKFVPEAYLYGSVSQRIALLQGLMDTDGYFGQSPEFSSASIRLAEAVVWLTQSLGGTASIAKKTDTFYKASDGSQKCGLPSYRVVLSLPPGINPFSLSRKADRFKSPSRGVGRWIDSIEPCGYGESVCIKVDAEDGLFVTEHCVVTHNTRIFLDYARHVRKALGDRKKVLIVSPLMVVSQTVAECERFYGDTGLTQIRAKDLHAWAESPGGGFGITNYEALTDAVSQGNVGCLIIDESSSLKSMYGKHASHCLRIGAGLEWKLALTGTPAPNDRIEYANHAVFLDAFPTVNSFLARFFVNKGSTGERWEMKPHAVGPFFRALSHWSIFLNDPGTYGWKDNAGTLPPIHVHIHDVDLTEAQTAEIRKLSGMMIGFKPGGIGTRSKFARIAKGGDSLKPAFIRGLIESWPDESTLVWCRFNDEQDRLAREIPGCHSMKGDTPHEKRAEMIRDFQEGRVKVLVSKPEILGFGLNLQIATRQIFSSLHDSWESFHQAVKRSNRVGSTRPLNVHIPVTEAERPMVETVLQKADRIDRDTAEQERIFKDAALGL